MKSFHGLNGALDLFLSCGSSVEDGTVRRGAQHVLQHERRPVSDDRVFWECPTDLMQRPLTTLALSPEPGKIDL